MIQKVTLNKGNVLTKSNIVSILNNARSDYSYARIELHNGIYFTVTYNRDSTIEISTNTRDIQVIRHIQSLRKSYTQTRLADNIFNWINMFNK